MAYIRSAKQEFCSNMAAKRDGTSVSIKSIILPVTTRVGAEKIGFT